ncbi:MAG: prolyl oligopeptidase family serine peptidase [Gemmatimonadota bacterium]
MRCFRALIVVAFAAVVTPASAQAPASSRASTAERAVARVLTQTDYDLWRSIQGATLSNDGRWVLYTVQPLVGEGELVVRSTATDTEYRHTRGFTGRPPAPGIPGGGGPGEEEEEEEGGGPAARFSSDGRFVVFLVEPSRMDVEAAERDPGRGSAQPRNSLAIMRLADGQVTFLPDVGSYGMAEESARYVAVLLEPDSAAARPGAQDSARAPNVAAAEPGGVPRPVAGDSSGRAAGRRKVYGSTLVLRELATGEETRVADVVSFRFNRAGTWLAYAVSSRTPANDGVYLRSLTSGAVTAVLTGPGNYRQLGFDRAGEQVAFVSDRDEHGSEQPRFTLYHATIASPPARALVTSDGVAGGQSVADRGQLGFTRDGTGLLFSIAPPSLDSIPADSLADKAVYDLWHWRDPRLQSQQQLSARRDRQRTYTGVYHLAAGRFVQLTNDSFPSVSLSDDGRIGVTSTNVPYAVESMWGDGGTDVYLVDALTGARTKVLARASSEATLSPAAKYLTWFNEGRWFAHGIASGTTVDLTGPTGVQFDQETHDRPSTPPAWGVAGWTRDDASVLVYDRFDIWELDPVGVRAPRVVTDSVGRRSGISFRVEQLDPEERFLDPARPLLLRAVDDETKASGFWQDRLDADSPPTRITMMDRSVGSPSKARNAEQYLVTQSTFREFPDLWTGPQLDRLTRISNANPQQSEYRWGTVEIVSWLNTDGVPVRGLLYKPDDFDPAKKYPMVVYFYEQHTRGLHNYSAPSGRNVINAPVYVSKGYLVFMPDIHYTDGYPGPSALKTIVPGVQYLIAQGFVKPDGVGIQGQSWGGYQTAYVITQSNLFSAAMAGAPVANMTSAYGGIRWESGNSRAGQYESGQSRIGGSPWEFPTRFIENSPLFHADRIRTPLLIMHNDNDGAVPWQQGIEMFIALRRLGREAYLINYNGDAHNPRKRANQRDMDIKMQQFFDHHLTGAPAPDWMVVGIPFLVKGRDQLVPPTAASNGAQGRFDDR